MEQTEKLINELEEIKKKWIKELEELKKERAEYESLNKELKKLRNSMLGNTALTRKITKKLYKIDD